VNSVAEYEQHCADVRRAKAEVFAARKAKAAAAKARKLAKQQVMSQAHLRLACLKGALHMLLHGLHLAAVACSTRSAAIDSSTWLKRCAKYLSLLCSNGKLRRG
jgi:hypothetical protein